MLPHNRCPTSPGETLRHFLDAYKLTQSRLAQHLGCTTTQVSQLVNE